MTVKVKKIPPRTLRDDIAIEAMRSFLANRLFTSPEDAAKDSYAYADAMMAERVKKKEGDADGSTIRPEARPQG